MDKPICKLLDTDGNVFIIIGKVTKALKKANQEDKAKEFTTRAFKSKSYEDVLILLHNYVEAT